MRFGDRTPERVGGRRRKRRSGVPSLVFFPLITADVDGDSRGGDDDRRDSYLLQDLFVRHLRPPNVSLYARSVEKTAWEEFQCKLKAMFFLP